MSIFKKISILAISLLVLAGAVYLIWNQVIHKEPAQNANSSIKVEENNIPGTETPEFNDKMREAQTAFGKGEYDRSIELYQEALKLVNSDKPYSGMYISYTAKKDWKSAETALNRAIAINERNHDYRKWKLSLLSEFTDTSFGELKNLYDEAMPKIDPRGRTDLTAHFARIAEKMGRQSVALELWKKAKELGPEGAVIYQKEIDRLEKLGVK